MYDVVLMQDVKDYKKGCYRIEDLEYAKQNMLKIIQNRTKDKMYLLKCMLDANVINNEVYAELVSRVKSDYDKSQLYIRGMISQDELI